MDIKKLVIIAAAAATAAAATAVLAGCAKVENDKDVDNAWTFHGMDCYTKVVEVEGHKYIIMDSYYAGNIVHAASCECLKK